MMTKPSARRWLSFAAALLLIGRPALSPATAATEAASKPTVTLSPGMSAAEITRLLGQPAEITKIENTGGQGERWIYRQPVGPKADASKPQTYQVLTLLMIESRLVVARQSTEEKPAAGK